MPDIYSVADDYAERLAKKETKATVELTRIYARAADAIRAAVAALQAEIAATKAKGETPTKTSIQRLDRYHQVLVQVNEQLVLAAHAAEPVITREVEDAIYLANKTLLAYSRLSGIPARDAFSTVSPAMVKLAAGIMDRGPLLDLLESKAAGGAEVIADKLMQGLIEGWSYDKMAKEMTAAVGGVLSNALTIARTETQRVNRMANLESFQSNVAVEKWIWRANLGTKCCAFCWSQHGTIHDLDEPMATHPNCRCQVMPYIESYPFGPPGEDLFAHRSKADQKKILGGPKFRAYEKGAISLPDVAGTKSHPDWGPVGYEKSLTAILGAKKAASYYKP